MNEKYSIKRLLSYRPERDEIQCDGVVLSPEEIVQRLNIKSLCKINCYNCEFGEKHDEVPGSPIECLCNRKQENAALKEANFEQRIALEQQVQEMGKAYQEKLKENKGLKAQLAQIKEICFKWNEYPSNVTGDEAMVDIVEVLKDE